MVISEVKNLYKYDEDSLNHSSQLKGKARLGGIHMSNGLGRGGGEMWRLRLKDLRGECVGGRER